MRLGGVVLVLAGTAFIGFSPNRWDAVILTIPRGHGVHVRDVIGMLAVGMGLAMLWRAPTRR